LLETTAIDSARPPWATLGGAIFTGEDVQPAENSNVKPVKTEIVCLTTLSSSPWACVWAQASLLG